MPHHEHFSFCLQTEKERTNQYKSIMQHLRPNEISNPGLIDKAVIDRVAAAAKLDPSIVRQFLLMSDRMKLLYEYVQLLQRGGETVPSTEEAFVRMQTSDPRFQALAAKEMTSVKRKHMRKANNVSVRVT